MHCQIIDQEGRIWCPRCQCDYHYSAAARSATEGDLSRVRRECPGMAVQAPEPPSLARRGANFARAAARHLWSGAVSCSEEQIAARFAICQACALFRPEGADGSAGICTHASCGCAIKRRRSLRNKAAWASQDCPLAKWPRGDDPYEALPAVGSVPSGDHEGVTDG